MTAGAETDTSEAAGAGVESAVAGAAVVSMAAAEPGADTSDAAGAGVESGAAGAAVVSMAASGAGASPGVVATGGSASVSGSVATKWWKSGTAAALTLVANESASPLPSMVASSGRRGTLPQTSSVTISRMCERMPALAVGKRGMWSPTVGWRLASLSRTAQRLRCPGMPQERSSWELGATSGGARTGWPELSLVEAWLVG